MKIAIIGGGMAGLGAAFELAERDDLQITIFEKNETLGGLASSIKIGNENLETFYHHAFPNFLDFIEIAEKTGSKKDLFFKKASSGIFYNRKIYPINGPADVLRFTPLSLIERLRMGMVLAYLKTRKDYRNFEKVTAANWLTKNLGEKTYRIMWEPLLSSKFGRDSDKVSMTWFWGRIHERPVKFGYLNGGFKIFVDALEQYLKSKGVGILLNSLISRIESKNKGFSMKTPQGEEFFDNVIFAGPPQSLIKAGESILPGEFILRIKNLKYVGTVCGIMLLSKPLTRFYWININEKEYPFVAVVEHSNFVSAERYGGMHPVYLPRYISPDDPFYNLSEKDIWNRFLPFIKNINPDFNDSWILEKYMFKAPSTQPVIPVKYGELMPRYQTPIPGFWWVSMSHIYPWDRGTNHSLRVGRELAREVISTQPLKN